MTKPAGLLQVGARVQVLWGFDVPRAATILEVWGDPSAPSQVRVEMDADDGEETAILLLTPAALVPAA